MRKILLEEIWNFLTILIRAFQDIIMQQRMALSRICFQARFCKERKVCGRHRRRIFFSFWCLRMAKNEWTNVESKEKRGFLGFRRKKAKSLVVKFCFPFLMHFGICFHFLVTTITQVWNLCKDPMTNALRNQ